MDPNAVLAELRAIVNGDKATSYARTIELLGDLDARLSRGEPLPEEWRPRWEVRDLGNDGWIVVQLPKEWPLIWYSKKDPDCAGMAQRMCDAMNGKPVPGIWPLHNMPPDD